MILNRVTIPNNIFEKANAVQTIYLKRGKPIISIAFVGRGISVKLPPELAVCATLSKIPLRNGKELQINYDKGEMYYPNGKIKWVFSFTETKWQEWRSPLIGEVIDCLDELLDCPSQYSSLVIPSCAAPRYLTPIET